MKQQEIADALRYRRADVANEAGCSIATADRLIIPEAVAAGILHRRGRYWYGRPGALAAWLCGEDGQLGERRAAERAVAEVTR
jgi:hypothetical protein